MLPFPSRWTSLGRLDIRFDPTIHPRLVASSSIGRFSRYGAPRMGDCGRADHCHSSPIGESASDRKNGLYGQHTRSVCVCGGRWGADDRGLYGHPTSTYLSGTVKVDDLPLFPTRMHGYETSSDVLILDGGLR